MAAGVGMLFLTGMEAVRQLRGGDGFAVSQAHAPLQLPERIDINEAAAYELELLPGVGPKTAEAVVADRSQRGEYQRLEDLTRVPGIGPKTVERLRPHVMCRPAGSELKEDRGSGRTTSETAGPDSQTEPK